MPSDCIFDVHHIVRDSDMSICCRCPHCQSVIGIEGEEFSDVRGEQFQCRCGGWLQVDYSAKALKRDSELPENKGVEDHDQ